MPSTKNELFELWYLLKRDSYFSKFSSHISLNSPVKIQSILDSFNQANPKLKSQLEQTQNTIEKLPQSTIKNMLNFYYKNVHNTRVLEGINQMNYYVDKINASNMLLKPAYYMRSYSTLARRPLNSNNYFPNPLVGNFSSTAASLHSSLNLNNDLTKPINKTNEKGNKGIATQTTITTKGNDSVSSISYDLNSPIFGKLISLLNEGVNKETQLQIEQLLKSQALEIAKYKLDSQGESPKQNFHHRLLILKLKEISPRLEKIIKNYKTKLILMDSNLSSLNSKIIYNMNTTFLISIMYGRLINIISNNQLLNNKTYQVEVTIDLGRDIVNKYKYEIYKTIKQSNPSLTYIQWKEENSSTEIISQTSESQFLFELGNLLINFMTDLQLIKTEVKILAIKEKKTILVAGPALVNLVPELETSFSIQAIPNRIPMVCPPKPFKYTENKISELGGYLLNGEEYLDEIILPNRELSSNSKILKNNEIVDMINKINSVAFKINENVLDFILINNHKYGFFTDTNYVNPLNSKKKLTITEKKLLSSFNSRKHLELNILGLATIFRDVSSIYLPVRIDYRGRLYCTTEYLNYQGIDLSKGLLEFSSGEKVELTDQEAINYLKIFGANCFGNGIGKKSFYDRIAWVDNNRVNIENFENGILLNQAENKTIFLSFCFEFKKYVEALNNHSSYFVSNLPIQLDASCNGFQHLTLLVDDLALAKELNLNEASKEDVPKDFYTFIGFKVKNYFVNKLEENRQGKLKLTLEEIESYSKLAELDIFRDLIKKAVMTIPYNASASAIVDYLKLKFEKKKNPELESKTKLELRDVSNEILHKDYYVYVLKSDKSKNEKVLTFKEIDFKNLRKALNISIFVDYPKLTALAEYLKGIANVANKLEIQIPWYLPSGLEINQQFFKTEVIKIKPFAYTKNVVNLSVLNKTKFNKNKQKIALMPNLIHSLDAASLCLVIVNYFKETDNINFYSIHDCFAVPCNKVNILTGLLKSAYCIIYSESNYLENFDLNFRSLITKTFGESAVSFKNEEGKVIIKFKDEELSIKFPSINSVVKNKKSEITVKNSNYLIH
jgi:DNA-dependent RNA polymerase